jgi:large subunit ribosomal protein L32
MHKYIGKVALASCPKCGKPILSHTACKNCGHYKGKEVVDVMAKLTKKEAKNREKEIKTAEKESKS